MEGFDRATSWTSWYFFGLAAAEARALTFEPAQVQALLELVGARSAVAGLAPVDPRHLISPTKFPVWAALFASALVQDRDGLEAVSDGTALLLSSFSIYQGTSTPHVGWPERVLGAYRLDPRDGRHPFILPLLVHASAPRPRAFEQTLRSPDGRVEIFGIAQFDETKPEALLAIVQAMAESGGSV